MARTTSDAVKAILLSNYDSATNPSLTAFIDTATAMVDEVVTEATERSLTISSTLLERIEAYLSAHFYGLSDQFYTSRSTAGASGSFQGQTGMGLDATLYGQTAKRLDPTGILAGMDESVGYATMTWLGKAPSNQTDYVDRD